MRGTIKLIFDDAQDRDVSEVGDFLFLFRGVYAAATLFVGEQLDTVPEASVELIRTRLRAMPIARLRALFSEDLGPQKLVATHIGRQSPWTILLEGLPLALVAAAIFSGGEVKLPHFEAKLPPLGEGIKKLREALAPQPRLTAAYSIQIRIIKLSKEEFDELMHHSGRGKGGFQTLIKDLQRRVDPKTRDLQLSEESFDKLRRYSLDWKKGGWQASIKKIFGRHFKE